MKRFSFLALTLLLLCLLAVPAFAACGNGRPGLFGRLRHRGHATQQTSCHQQTACQAATAPMPQSSSVVSPARVPMRLPAGSNCPGGICPAPQSRTDRQRLDEFGLPIDKNGNLLPSR